MKMCENLKDDSVWIEQSIFQSSQSRNNFWNILNDLIIEIFEVLWNVCIVYNIHFWCVVDVFQKITIFEFLKI